MRGTRLTLFIITLVLILIVDLLSKQITIRYLPYMIQYYPVYPYGGIGVFQEFLGVEFSIVYAKNTGAAWGLFKNFQLLLLVFRIIFVSALFVYLFFINKEKKYSWPLILILSGAIGNILDYFIYGHVIDMFNFVFWGYDYPVFNIADSSICIGVIWLFFISFCSKKQKTK
jgi:signal peptidase II